ncbi:hypothetical protein BDN72DRAFT_859418 [Pluteus cervinus]|uniref:Uncharacterized protein n=1 Tax=Pluteus cervinus TaxID=181527 RepID=A0ACD3AMA8_9AGAR|nr:hypothetical protein BDN72DRAFT_859418 [Pluteus cervinus]
MVEVLHGSFREVGERKTGRRRQKVDGESIWAVLSQKRPPWLSGTSRTAWATTGRRLWGEGKDPTSRIGTWAGGGGEGQTLWPKLEVVDGCGRRGREGQGLDKSGQRVWESSQGIGGRAIDRRRVPGQIEPREAPITNVTKKPREAQILG